MTRKVVSPIALDKSFNTTEATPRNIADVLVQQLVGIKTAIESGNGNLEAVLVCYYGVTTATQIKEAIEAGKVPYFYYNGVVAQLWKVETDKYTFRTTNTRSVEGQTILDVVDYIVNGSVWSTVTKEVSGGSYSGQSYITSVKSLADFDTTGYSGMHSVLSVDNVPADGVYQLSVMLHITPKTASATKSDLVFHFTSGDGTGWPNHTFHAVVDDSQTFAQQLSFSTSVSLKAGQNTLRIQCGDLNTEYLVFVDELTVAQLVNGVYHNGDDFDEVHTLTEAAAFNNDDGVLVDGATGGPRFMLWRTLANKVLGFIKSLSTTITAFRTGDVIPVDGPSGTAKMSKDDLLAETAQNALGSIHSLIDTATEADLVAGNYLALDGNAGTKKLAAEAVAKRNIQDHIVASIENEFSSSNNYVLGNKVQHNGGFYIFTKDHAAGAWTGTDVINIPFALRADTFFDYSIVSLTGISEVGNIGSIVKKEINVSIGTTVTVTIPNPTWNVSNISAGAGYCFICGYYDANGAGNDVKQYNSADLLSHAGETITLPAGYTRYYVEMRGNTGEVATFFITTAGPLVDNIKTEGRISSRKGTVKVTGADNTPQVVQIPLYGSAKVSIDIPSVYPVSSIWGPANVYEVGYYTEVTERVTGSNIPRQYVENINANSVSQWAGTTRTIQVPASTKSLYLFIRCDAGEELEFGYTIEQETGTGIGNNDASIRELQLASSDENVGDATLYNFVDLRSSDTLSVSESDFPSSMKRLSDKYILARPILRNPGDLTWGSGFCIAPDGKVLCACYGGSNHYIGVADLYKPHFKAFNKAINGGNGVHSNYMWFGTEKYDAGDLYPLLYIGGKDSSLEGNTCNVIRIVGDLESSATCNFVIVQTITFDAQFGIIADVRKWGNKLVAIYGNKIWICSDFPSVLDGTSVTISYSDVETSYEITDLTFPSPIQSGCIVGDKVYYICGIGTTAYLIIVDLNDGSAVQTKMPNYGEWETLSYFNDIFFAMTVSRNENLVAQEMIVCSLEFNFGQSGI